VGAMWVADAIHDVAGNPLPPEHIRFRDPDPQGVTPNSTPSRAGPCSNQRLREYRCHSDIDRGLK